MTPHLNAPYWALRIGFGLIPILAGLDKFTNLLVDWTRYISPFVESLLPVSPATFMGAVGLVEVAVGVLVLSRWTRFGAYAASGWLVLIALQLLIGGAFDVAVRDLAMAVAAFTLARLDEVRSETVPSSASAAERAASVA